MIAFTRQHEERRVARRFAPRLRRSQVSALLASRVDEDRFVALQVLVRDYQAGGPSDRERIANRWSRWRMYFAGGMLAQG